MQMNNNLIFLQAKIVSIIFYIHQDYQSESIEQQYSNTEKTQFTPKNDGFEDNETTRAIKQ